MKKILLAFVVIAFTIETQALSHTTTTDGDQVISCERNCRLIQRGDETTFIVDAGRYFTHQTMDIHSGINLPAVVVGQIAHLLSQWDLLNDNGLVVARGVVNNDVVFNVYPNPLPNVREAMSNLCGFTGPLTTAQNADTACANVDQGFALYSGVVCRGSPWICDYSNATVVDQVRINFIPHRTHQDLSTECGGYGNMDWHRGNCRSAVHSPSAVVDELLASARSACSGISGQLDRIRVAAGLGIAAGAVSAIAGGTATAAGIYQIRSSRAAARAESEGITYEQALATEPEIDEYDPDIEAYVTVAHDADGNPVEQVTFRDRLSGAAPTIQTAGAFVAGGTAVVGAVSAFVGAAQFGDIISDMNNCAEVIRELDNASRRMSFESPNDPRIEMYGNIVRTCSGMRVSNIEAVRNAMRAAGIISGVGAVTGIAGGVVGVVQNRNSEEGAAPGAATTILAGAATAAGATTAIISGAVLAGLNRNSDIARACANAF